MPTRDLPVVGDSFTQAERVKSLIPVLPWQTGLSYYNNYSSKKPGDTGGPRPVREIEQLEPIALFDQRLTERYRDITQADQVAGVDTPLPRAGRSAQLASDGAQLTDSQLGRRGLWTIPEQTEVVGVTDRALSLNGRRNFLGTDSFNVADTMPPFKFDWRDTAGLSDSAAQNGLRVQNVLENFYAIDYHLSVQGRRTFTVQDAFTLTDRKAEFNGIRSLAAQGDDAQALDSGWRRGRWNITVQDTVAAGENGYQRGGLRQQRGEREAIMVADSTPPFRFDWRDDPYSLADSGVQSGLRAQRGAEALTVGERAFLDTPQARDSWTLSEIGTKTGQSRSANDGAALVERSFGDRDLAARDVAGGSDSGRLEVRPVLRGEQVGIQEAASTERYRFTGRPETVLLNEQAQIPMAFPQLADDVSLVEAAVQNGIRVRFADDLATQGDGYRIERYTTRQAEDTVLTGDSGRVSGLRTWRDKELPSLLDSYAIIKDRPVLGGDQVALAERSGSLRDILRRDELLSLEASLRGAAEQAMGRSDAGSLSERFELGYTALRRDDSMRLSRESTELRGTLRPEAADTARLGEVGVMVNLTPRHSDLIGSEDRDLRITGRRAQLGQDEAGLTGEEHGGAHGRRAFKFVEYLSARDYAVTSRDLPVYADRIMLGERVDGGEKGRSDLAYLRESATIDPTDTTDYPVLREGWSLSNQTPRARDVAAVTDRRAGTAFDQTARDTAGLRPERRVLARDVYGRDDMSTDDHYYRKFSRSDFLDIKPHQLRERPRRTRGDVQMRPGEILGVVYAEGGQVHRVTGRYADTWKGHTRELLGRLPTGATHVSGNAERWAYQQGEEIVTGERRFAGRDPLMIGPELYYLSSDRLRLYARRQDDDFETERFIAEMPRRGFIKQRSPSGPLVHDRLDRVMHGQELHGAGPQDRGSVVWRVQGVRTDVPPIIPSEGSVTGESIYE